LANVIKFVAVITFTSRFLLVWFFMVWLVKSDTVHVST